jgi:hypothetical protein
VEQVARLTRPLELLRVLLEAFPGGVARSEAERVLWEGYVGEEGLAKVCERLRGLLREGRLTIGARYGAVWLIVEEVAGHVGEGFEEVAAGACLRAGGAGAPPADGRGVDGGDLREGALGEELLAQVAAEAGGAEGVGGGAGGGSGGGEGGGDGLTGRVRIGAGVWGRLIGLLHLGRDHPSKEDLGCTSKRGAR